MCAHMYIFSNSGVKKSRVYREVSESFKMSISL